MNERTQAPNITAIKTWFIYLVISVVVSSCNRQQAAFPREGSADQPNSSISVKGVEFRFLPLASQKATALQSNLSEEVNGFCKRYGYDKFDQLIVANNTASTLLVQAVDSTIIPTSTVRHTINARDWQMESSCLFAPFPGARIHSIESGRASSFYLADPTSNIDSLNLIFDFILVNKTKEHYQTVNITGNLDKEADFHPFKYYIPIQD